MKTLSAVLATVKALLLGYSKTSLLRRLQAQTLPDATPPISKIHPFSKIAVNFVQFVQFAICAIFISF